MKSKKEWREEILALRKQMSGDEVAEKSRAICRHVMESEEYAKAENLCLYMPIRNEVDLRPLIEPAEASGKAVWTPKVTGGEMIFNAFEGDELMREGAFRIPESTSERVLEPGRDTLILMPGSVFDRKGNRIGYGGGYYDRYLEAHPDCRTIAVAYGFQIVESLPAEVHDVRPGKILTETGEAGESGERTGR